MLPQWTAEVANEVTMHTEVVGVENKFQIIETQGGVASAGDMDVFTDDLLLNVSPV